MSKRLLVLPVAATAALALAVAPAGAVSTINLKDNFFSPKSTAVKKSTTVTFRWAGEAPHNVMVRSGPGKFRSTTKTSGTYRKKLTVSGLYRITCTVHPGMDLALRVR